MLHINSHLILLLVVALVADYIDSFDKPKQRKFYSQISAVLVPAGATPINKGLYRFFWSPGFSRRMASIDLEQFYRKICTGALEIRDPSDLVCLLMSKMHLEFPVTFEANLRWRMSVWMHRRWPPRYTGNPTVTTGYRAHYGTRFALDVGSLPYRGFEEYLHSALLAIPPKCRVLLRVVATTSDMNNTKDNLNLSLCALPFLPPLFMKKADDNLQETLVPVLIPVDRIVALLLLHIQDYTILQIINHTSVEAQDLQYQADSLLGNKSQRMQCIQEHGLDGWRENRLRLMWKAALLSSAKLAGWHIIVERNGQYAI